jgi:translation initiation factor IF-2
MRSRGAQVTDIAVLVVAADDGVMPQTIEAMNHARAAEVPIVVAVTKIDRDNADPTRVRQQLTENELVPEEWGGDTIVVDVSAPTGQGVDQLLDSLIDVADVLLSEELVANPKKPAVAAVLEAHLDQGRGPVVSALVEEGTLRVGDTIVAGPAWGRVRAMFDETGAAVTEAGPSVPVEVLGLADVPMAGDELRVAPNDKVARTVAEARAHRRKAAALRNPLMLAGGARLEDVFAAVQRGEVATLNLIVKADAQGSLEAIIDALRKLDQEHDEVRLSFVHRGVGGITESDASLAVVSNATVIGFNVRPDRKARELAEQENVEVRLYEVIYNVLEDVNNALVGMLKPEYEEVSKTSTTRSSACSSRSTKRSSPEKPKFAWCTPCRVSARSPVASSRTASSRVVRRSVSCGTAPSSGRVPSRRFADSRTTSARFGKASSAVSGSRTTPTSRKVTSSRRSRSARSPGFEPLACRFSR